MPATILDWAGRPMKRTGSPSAGQVLVPSKSAWFDSLATDITPANIISYLNAADRGMLDKQAQLFDRMVDRDDRLQAVLETRKLAVTGVARDVLPAIPDDPRAEKAADLCRENLLDLIDDPIGALLDGVPKGIACLEVIWEGSDVVGLREIPQRLLRWSTPDLLELDYSGGSSKPDWRELEESKFVLYCPRNKPGSKERRGLLRSLSMLWVAKHWAMRDWAAFVEVFGMPMRVGVYPDNVSDEQRAILYEALQDLGTDSSALIPESVRIEFPKAIGGNGGTSDVPMAGLVGYVDRSYAIRVLGQNLTTEGVSGSGTLAGGAHENVRADYRKADARTVANAIEEDLFRPFVGYNLGWDYPTPRLWFDVEDAQDDELRAKVYTELAKVPGMTFSRSQIREEFALREPIDDEDTLRVGEDPGTDTINPLATAAGIKGKAFANLPDDPDRRSLSEGTAACENVAESAADDVIAHAIKNVVGYVERLAEDVDTPEQLLRRIRLAAPSLIEDMETAGITMDDLADVVGRAMMTCEYNGEASVLNELDAQSADRE
jgi:phage gp29-like protein